MSAPNDPVDVSLSLLARTTRNLAPAPAPLAVVRILAARRRTGRRARRLLVLVSAASAVPLLIVLSAWRLHPAAPSGPLLVAALLAGSLGVAIDGLARVAGEVPPP
jgi:hypothetical protein